MPFDYTQQPEFAGPLTEPRSAHGAPTFDFQALAQRTVRLPRLADTEDGSLVPLSEPDPFIDHDPGFIARERAAALRRDLFDGGGLDTPEGRVLARQILAANAPPEPAAEPEQPAQAAGPAGEPSAAQETAPEPQEAAS
jgi:hypothetical protein